MLSNINACLSVVDTIKTTLGPRGMDKMIVDSRGKATISNDGATIMKLLEIVHPAARTLVDIARAQDAEVGDGTTSVVVFAGELLRQVKDFVEDRVPPRVIIKGFRMACELALEKVKELSVSINKDDPKQFRDVLEKCASTAMNSKLIHNQKDFFKTMVVDSVLMLDDDLNLKMIGTKKVPGGAIEDSVLVDGVAFEKTFTYAGFEQQPKSFTNPKILCLNIELELKAERTNAEVRINKVDDYQQIVNAEWSIIFEKLDKIVESGANVVLSKLPIGDLAVQYFADRGLFCAGRVKADDLDRVVKAVGGSIQTSVNNLSGEHLGTCLNFEEKQVGGVRYNFFTGCTEAKTCTFLLRGGSEQFIAEIERSLHDSIMIVRRAIRNQSIVAGGGALEMELSKYLREYSRTIQGRQQMIIAAYAKAFEVIPKQLCENAGFDSTDIMNQLRKKHVQGGIWYGVDINNEAICDNFDNFVWEPSLIKSNMLSAATEAACLILSVDETVRNAQSQNPAQPQPSMGGMAGR